jgi:hypothetical protein
LLRSARNDGKIKEIGMFGKMKDMMGQMQMIQQLMKDENFKAFMSHPKIQQLMKDPEFIAMLKTQDFKKIALHPKFSVLRDDKELAELASKLKFPGA